MNGDSGVSVDFDILDLLRKQLEALTQSEILVGIPEDKDARADDSPIGNAGIGYAMEFGMPENNVPARPFLIPGVTEAKESILRQLQLAAEAALSGRAEEAQQRLNAAGVVASNSVRQKIDSNIPPPLAPSTVRNRKYARGTASRRESEDVYLGLIREGVDPSTAQNVTGIKTLVNTGKLLASITYVVRHKEVLTP